MKILARLVTQFEVGLKEEVLAFILEDVRGRLDLAFAWLYQEYNAHLGAGPTGTLDKYDACLIRLLSGLQEKPDQKDGCVCPSIPKQSLVRLAFVPVLFGKISGQHTKPRK